MGRQVKLQQCGKQTPTKSYSATWQLVHSVSQRMQPSLGRDLDNDSVSQAKIFENDFPG